MEELPREHLHARVEQHRRPEADAEPLAAAEGDQRVRELIACAVRVVPRIHEAEDPLDAIRRGQHERGEAERGRLLRDLLRLGDVGEQGVVALVDPPGGLVDLNGVARPRSSAALPREQGFSGGSFAL